MREPTLILTKTSLPIDAIELHGRLRPVSEAGVATILASIREIGQLANPIVVRQLRRDGETIWRVLDGAHRLAAAKELGWTEVPVRVFECTDDQARLLEVDGNLAGAELNPLDQAVFLAARKRVYEKLHPETKADAFKGNRHTGSLVAELSSFARTTAEKFGMTDRQVRKIIAAGSRLGPDEIAQLRRAPKPVTLADLQAISNIVNPAERCDVVKLLEGGKAKSATDARRVILQRDAGDATEPADLAEVVAADLTRRWGRAPMAAKRRFAEQVWAEMSRILRDAGDDEAEAA